MKLTVMLVDDEYIVLKGLEALITNQKEVPLQVFPFTDAFCALAWLNKMHPDVIITDINMPELDGLTFVERAIEQGYGGKLLIISGYEEMEYYKKALALHIADYLLKPVDKQRLIHALSQLYSDLVESQQVNLLVLQQALTYRHSNSYIDEMRGLFPSTNIVTYVVHGLSIAIGEKQKEALSSYFSPIHVVRYGALTTFLCNFDNVLTRRDLLDAWINAAAETALKIPTGISRIYSADDAFLRASRGLGMPLLLEAALDYVAHALGIQCDERWYDYADILISIHDFNQYECLCEALQSEADPFLCAAILALSVNSIQNGNLPNPDILKSFVRNRRQTLVTSQSILNLLWMLPVEYRILESMEQRCVYSERIERALRYMKAHFAEDLSLGDVAQSVDLSPNYFSALFAKEVGKTFLEYLHGVRMEVACCLLERTSQSVESIASSVGYRSVGHFHKLFRKKYTVSPGRWRKAKQIL